MWQATTLASEGRPVEAEDTGHNYVDSFVTSSNRVRYVILTITVTCILMLVAFVNSLEQGWFNQRVRTAHLAHELRVLDQGFSPRDEKESAALDWAKSRGFSSKEELLFYVQEIDKQRIANIILLRLPIAGAVIDVNDLGVMGGLALIVQMLMLTFAMSRQHENLYLALWQIRAICKRSRRTHAQGDSQANLRYHSLAMAQQFNQPPTLARWRPKRIGSLSRLLIVLPGSVMSAILIHDFFTKKAGNLLSSALTSFSFWLSFLETAMVWFLVGLCFVYTLANDRRWRDAFFYINPHFLFKPQPQFFRWIRFWGQREEVRNDFDNPICYPVLDFHTMKTFYVESIGFSVVAEWAAGSGLHAELELDGQRLFLHGPMNDGEAEAQPVSRFILRLRHRGFSELTERLRARQVPAERREFGGLKAITARDPQRSLLEIVDFESKN